MKKSFSNRFVNALNTEAKNINIVHALYDKNMSTKNDILLLTGIRPNDYDNFFEEENGTNNRGIPSVDYAMRLYKNHLKRDDLTPVQRAVSRLLLKGTQDWVVSIIADLYYHLTDRFLEDDFWDEDAFAEETYQISEDELEEVAQLVLEYVKELESNQNA